MSPPSSRWLLADRRVRPRRGCGIWPSRRTSSQRSKIIATLNLDVPQRELNHADAAVQLRAIMGVWLPLGRNVLRAAVQHLPSATQAQGVRVAKLCPAMADAPEAAQGELAPPMEAGSDATTGRDAAARSVRRGIETCDASAPALVHIAKMVYAAGVRAQGPNTLSPRHLALSPRLSSL